MASLTLRNLEPRLMARLRVRATRSGGSMEDEAHVILRAALAGAAPRAANLAARIRRRFEPLGGVEPALPPRDPIASSAPRKRPS